MGFSTVLFCRSPPRPKKPSPEGQGNLPIKRAAGGNWGPHWVGQISDTSSCDVPRSIFCSCKNAFRAHAEFGVNLPKSILFLYHWLIPILSPPSFYCNTEWEASLVNSEKWITGVGKEGGCFPAAQSPFASPLSLPLLPFFSIWFTSN